MEETSEIPRTMSPIFKGKDGEASDTTFTSRVGKGDYSKPR